MCDDKIDQDDSQRKPRTCQGPSGRKRNQQRDNVEHHDGHGAECRSDQDQFRCHLCVSLDACTVGGTRSETIKDFAEMTRGKSKHNLGHPHVQAWATFMTTLIQHSADSAKEGPLAKCLQDLQESLTAFKTDGVEKAYMHISQFRAKITKEETHGVVSWCLSPMLEPLAATNLNRALVELLVHHKAEVTMGGPPPGPAERKLKADIAELKRKMGKTK